MEINGTMLNLESEISRILNNDENLNNYIKKGYYKNHNNKSPEWYEQMDFGMGDVEYPLGMESQEWRIYAACLREFGIVIFITDTLHLEDTRQTIKTLVEQYGLRNVTNEIAKQVKVMETK